MTMTRKTTDPHAVAEDAAASFTAALNRYIMKGGVDLEEATAALIESLRPIAAADRLDDLAAAVVAFRDLFDQNLTLVGGARDWVAPNFINRTGAVHDALGRCLVLFDRHEDLAAARAVLADAEAVQGDLTRKLEAAVAAADLKAVIALREQVEQTQPATVDGARLRVLQLEVARLRAERARPVRLADEAVLLRDQCARAHEDALRAAEAARVALGAAVRDLPAAIAIAQAATGRLEDAERELAELTEAAHASAQRRFRRLAGLAS